MKTPSFKDLALPHVLAVLAYALITTLYFSASVFEGKSLKQGDAAQWRGNAQKIIEHRGKYDEEPLWTSAMFSGMPTYTVSTLYHGEKIIEFVDEKVLRAGFPYPASIVFIGFVCFYITLLCFGAAPLEAALGAVGFTLFSFTIVSMEAGHNSKLRAMTYAPLVLAGMHLLFRQRWLWGFVLAALGAALQIRSGHYQITYYLGFLCVIFGISEFVYAILEKRIKPFAIATALLIVAAVVGVGVNAARLMTLQEYTQYSMRGKPELKPKDSNKPADGGLDRDYVFSWSHGVSETFTLLIPGMKGGSSSEYVPQKGEVAKLYGADRNMQFPYYWGDQPFTSGPVYAGAIMVFLFVLGLFVVEKRHAVWLGLTALLGAMLAMGKNLAWFNYPMYDFFPGYNKFRTVTMAIYLLQVSLPILAVLAIARVARWNGSREELTKKLYYAAGITGGLCALFFLIPSLGGDFSGANDEQLRQQVGDNYNQLIRAVEEDRKSMLRGDALRSLLFIAVAAGLVWALINQKIKSAYAVLALTVLTLFDLWGVDRRYLNSDNFQKGFFVDTFKPTEADQLMSQSPEGTYRVLNLANPFTESATSYYHNSLGGYSPVKLRRYQDMIENNLTGEIKTLISALQSGQPLDSAMTKAPAINMLNAKYLKYGDKATEVIPNPKALGNAWFVSEVKTVSTPDEEIVAIETIDPAKTAVVDTKKFPIATTQFSKEGASIKLKSYKMNDLVYETSNPAAGLAVFSEVYYPEGWELTIDGKPAELLRANYVLRAAQIPAGNHTVRMHFNPSAYRIGNQISWASSLLILGVLAAALAVTFYKREPKK